MLLTQDFALLGMRDLGSVGGKNASLGEMIANLSHLGVTVPGGFATTAHAYEEFLKQNNLSKVIAQELELLDVNNISMLTQVGQKIRSHILQAEFSKDFIQAITTSYNDLIKKIGRQDVTFAVRSSATAEDLPDASFAGQQETYLNVHSLQDVLEKIKHVFASLYNDRAIAYRVHHGFAHHDVAISAGVQQMVRSDLAASGVMFTLDTESGFRDVVFITSAYGLGELVVQGAVNPDEFYVYKPAIKASKPAVIRRQLGQKQIKMIYASDNIAHERVIQVAVPKQEQIVFSLTEDDLTILAKQALIIEEHYGRPMDIEWAKDGLDGKIYILQARPETVTTASNKLISERYNLTKKGKVLVEGRSIGQKIGQGRVKIIANIADMHNLEPGDVLVTDMTDPDWEPVMKRAAAIVTNRGGRTCHAAIIARELGIPAVVGCHNATAILQENQEVTVSCAEGDTGFIYEGTLAFDHIKIDLKNMPELPMKVMLNVGNPERAFAFQALPNSGVGLARLEFLISNTIGIHPKALLNFDNIQDENLKNIITERTQAYKSPVEFYVERLKEGIATIAAAFYPKPVIVRCSDFKSNEYAHLIGGQSYEPIEENPMLGFRGAARYVSQNFAECFALECRALKSVRDDMGFTNVEIMIPFVRTVQEGANVIELLRQHGLERGRNALKIIMMCELPSNALLAEEFIEHFDGFSIGSNDLTQLTLGLDRDSGLVAAQFDERNDAVKILLSMAITACKKHGKYVGICGQGPSDHPDFAEWLMQQGIDSVSLNPDSVLDTCLFLAKNV